MQFVSTRGRAPVLGFSDTVLTGLASDGGLYLPQDWPQISAAEIAGYANRPFTAVAFDVISRFVDGEIADAELSAIIDEAYAGFRHPSVAPLVEIGPGHFLLELFHGPTLAFKDVAMQFLARVMDHVLTSRGARATIVGATSGDTGSAAIEAFRGRDATDIFILHPEGRTSEVQRRQMTTVLDDNVHNIAVQGTFDDCQRLVKALFNNHRFRDGVHLSGVNSINWGRIVAQMVHDSLDAFARLDAVAALNVARRDDSVDEEYESIQRQAITFMMENPRSIRRALEVMRGAVTQGMTGDMRSTSGLVGGDAAKLRTGPDGPLAVNHSK